MGFRPRTTATGTATRSGSVDSVTITTAGSGYTAVPTVTFSAPPSGGTTATGTAVGTGSVDSVTVGTAGSGYPADPTVTFSGGGGSGAVASAVRQSGVASVTIVHLGNGYTTAPTVTFFGGAVRRHHGDRRRNATIRITSGDDHGPGERLHDGPFRDVFGRRRQRCGCLRVVDSDQSRGSDDHEPGSGYTSAPSVTFSASPAGSHLTARGTAVLQSGVASVTVTNGGAATPLPPP